MDSSMARASFAMANAIQTVPGHAPPLAGAAANAPYYFDEVEQHAIHRAKPWASDPAHFTTVHISAVALIKMAMHARSGGPLEIMGTLQGKLAANAFIITDTFPVPVVGTETRVNAVAEGYEFMVGYQSQCGAVGRRENVVGWYHSHPGYGCWLSGIDVETQRINQQYQDPFLAIVVDPVRTQSAGKVELGAFRTYPSGYVPPDAAGGAGGTSGDYQSIPSNKVVDFGVHCQQYYSLDVRFFQSTLDGGLLDGVWNRYWAASLSSSPLVSNREYVASCVRDLGTKMGAATEVAARSRARGLYMGTGAGGRKGIGSGGGGGGGGGGRSKGGGDAGGGKGNDSLMTQVVRDAQHVAHEHMHAMMTQTMKAALFLGVPDELAGGGSPGASDARGRANGVYAPAGEVADDGGMVTGNGDAASDDGGPGQ
ncbi:hypothetical protein MMPV_005054 [Pyropia vietnamensis]